MFLHCISVVCIRAQVETMNATSLCNAQQRCNKAGPSVSLITNPAVNLQGNLEERKDNADPQSNVFGSLLSTFGSVEVGGRNFFKLMQNGECVLLYPGGVREVCSLLHMPSLCLQRTFGFLSYTSQLLFTSTRMYLALTASHCCCTVYTSCWNAQFFVNGSISFVTH